MRKSLVVIAMIGSMIVLAGCNTVAGLGQDLKKGSEHVSDAIGQMGDKMTQKANSHQLKTGVFNAISNFIEMALFFT